MRSAHAVPDVRRAEQALMATLPDGTLMQRAAAGLAARCADLLDGVYGRRVALLVGAGDNGGDTLYAGGRLARRGARVDAVLLAPDKAHPGGLAALRRAGGRIVEEIPPRADLVLDGIVGIGGKPGLRPAAEEHVDAVERLDVPVVAVDVPSGIDVDSGETPARHVRADVTVTFGTHKIGLLAPPGAAAAGVVDLVDIGLGPWLAGSAGSGSAGSGSAGTRSAITGPALTALQAEDVAALLPEPGPADHKYTRGVVGVAAGSADYTGAGLLAVSGAACGLAGMVRYVGPAAVADHLRSRTPEAVVGPGRVQAWVVGSGGGSQAADALRRALADGVPVVVDADALGAAAERLETAGGAEGAAPIILTPHAGELATLLGVPRSDVEARPLHFARAAAERWDATVLLKGWRTLVATPGRPVAVNPTGMPWLATAGAGDVLAGLLGALGAAGLSAHDAAAVGAWLHGAAATVASRGGPIDASAIAAAIPEVVRGLGVL